MELEEESLVALATFVFLFRMGRVPMDFHLSLHWKSHIAFGAVEGVHLGMMCL